MSKLAEDEKREQSRAKKISPRTSIGKEELFLSPEEENMIKESARRRQNLMQNSGVQNGTQNRVRNGRRRPMMLDRLSRVMIGEIVSHLSPQDILNLSEAMERE
jgi:hypothetical protein